MKILTISSIFKEHFNIKVFIAVLVSKFLKTFMIKIVCIADIMVFFSLNLNMLHVRWVPDLLGGLLCKLYKCLRLCFTPDSNIILDVNCD